MNNNIDILSVKNFVDKKINWDNYNKSRRRNYRNTMMKEYKEGDLIIELSYMLYEQYHNNIINVPLCQEQRKEEINTTNYVSREKYDKIKKNNNHYKQQVEQRNSMIKNLNNQIEELKEKIEKLDKCSIDIMNEEELKEQNEELKEENANLYNELSKLKKQYNIT